jgi:RNA polymerase sigma-70 factor (ECF subfamily)
MSETPSNPLAAVNRSPGRAPDEKQATGVAAAADARLLEGVRAGDQQAMAEIFDRYGRMVYSVALRVLQDPGHAEDVMQDVLFKVWREPQSFLEGRGRLGAWLAVIARNRAIDALRRRKPTDAVEDVVLVSKTNISLEYERNTTIEKVRGVLKSLPLEQQMPMELAYFEGLSHSEIAARTGDPLGTVKTRIRTALTSLRKALEA